MFDTYPSNRNIIRILGVMLLNLVLWTLFSLALAWPVKLLWNWLMPLIFGLPAISFWQAAGMMLLVNILFRWNVSVGSSEFTHISNPPSLNEMQIP